MGIDKVGIDKVGIDEVGRYRGAGRVVETGGTAGHGNMDALNRIHTWKMGH